MMHKADIDKLTHTLIGLLDLLLIPSSFVKMDGMERRSMQMMQNDDFKCKGKIESTK
jgi:hypothetical protein